MRSVCAEGAYDSCSSFMGTASAGWTTPRSQNAFGIPATQAPARVPP